MQADVGPVGEVARDHMASLRKVRVQEQQREERLVERPDVEVVDMDLEVADERCARDSLDDLTMEELGSLLGNFKNLSKQEQVTASTCLMASVYVVLTPGCCRST